MNFDALPFSEWAQPWVELGIGGTGNTSPIGLWDQASWAPPNDGGSWAGTEPAWVQVDTCDTISIGITRGRARWFDRYGPGTATVQMMDREGRYSWANAPAAHRLLRPGCPLRVRAMHVDSGEIHELFRGYVETITNNYAPRTPYYLTVAAQDSLSQFERVNLPAQPIVGAGERSDQRVSRCLDLCGWPAEWRNLEIGRAPLQGTTLDQAQLEEMGIAADSEGGALYQDPEGTVRFRNRDWLRHAPEAVSVQATIGPEPDEVCASAYQSVLDAGDIANDVQVGAANRDPLPAMLDTGSISLYRHRTFQRTDFVNQNDSDVSILGTRILGARSQGLVRLPEVTIEPHDSDDFLFAMSVRFGWRVLVKYDPAATGGAALGPAWSRELLVQGINHTISTTSWETQLQLDDAFAEPTAGWDNNSGWDVALWAEVA